MFPNSFSPHPITGYLQKVSHTGRPRRLFFLPVCSKQFAISRLPGRLRGKAASLWRLSACSCCVWSASPAHTHAQHSLAHSPDIQHQKAQREILATVRIFVSYCQECLAVAKKRCTSYPRRWRRHVRPCQQTTCRPQGSLGDRSARGRRSSLRHCGTRVELPFFTVPVHRVLEGIEKAVLLRHAG